MLDALRNRLRFIRWSFSHPDEYLAERIRQLPPDQRKPLLPRELVDEERWHSWDPTPWRHPWLTTPNLRAAKAFQQELMASLANSASGAQAEAEFGFVGNLANNMAMRALPLRKQGLPVAILLHPFDRSVMSHPGWEIADLMIPSGVTDVDALSRDGIRLPVVEDVIELSPPSSDIRPLIHEAQTTPADRWSPGAPHHFVRQLDLLLWPTYVQFLPALQQLQRFSALFAAQAPYLAYLANRAYLAAQTGGDLWLECSRHDGFGNLQRRAYARATAILATNPWAYSCARRYGFRHVLYVPLVIDTDRYRPAESGARAEWQQQVGGDFFVLVTSRWDRKWKKSHIALNGFVTFAKRHAGVRLVTVGWGPDCDELLTPLLEQGLGDRVVRLPLSGKLRLIDYLRSADCLLDQFASGYYGATALEAMSTGVAVIMKLAAAQYDALCPTGAPPVLAADNAHEVSERLERLLDVEQRRRVGEASRKWIEANHSSAVWGDHYAVLLQSVARGLQVDWRRSPLAARLSRAEIHYHARGLEQAPRFPDYA